MVLKGPLKVDAQGLLSGCEYIPSPNCDDRPAAAIELLVIHNISLPPGEFGGDAVQRFFTNTLDPAAHPYYATIAGILLAGRVPLQRFFTGHRTGGH
jgi:AmpD protein